MIAVLLAAAIAASPAPPLSIDLSDREIAVTTGFEGADLLVFGAVNAGAIASDIVVAIRGPEGPAVVRRKVETAGIWMNRERVTFLDVPGFYHVAATRPLAEILDSAERGLFQLGVDRLRLAAYEAEPPADLDAFRQGLLRQKRKHGLYAEELGEVARLGPHLFRTRLFLPPAAPTGTYSVEVLLVADGRIVGQQTTPLFIRRAGTAAELYRFAHAHAALYGLAAIVVSIAAGWLAGLLFRKT